MGLVSMKIIFDVVVPSAIDLSTYQSSIPTPGSRDHSVGYMVPLRENVKLRNAAIMPASLQKQETDLLSDRATGSSRIRSLIKVVVFILFCDISVRITLSRLG